MASLMSPPYFNVGAGLTPADGAKLYFYVVDSATPKDTHNTAAATVANTNPLIADALGVFDAIYLSGEYDWVLTDKNGVQKNSGSVSEIATVTSGALTKNFDTLADAVTNINLVDGDALNLEERVSGAGGGGMWDVVLSSTVTENTFNIVQCTGVATLSLVLRQEPGAVVSSRYGAVSGADSTDAYQNMLDSNLDRSVFHIVEAVPTWKRITLSRDNLQIFVFDEAQRVVENPIPITNRGMFMGDGLSNIEIYGNFNLKGEGSRKIGESGFEANAYNTVSGRTGISGPANSSVYFLRSSKIKVRGYTNNTGESGYLFRNCGDLDIDVDAENCAGAGVELSYPASDGSINTMPVRNNVKVRCNGRYVNDLKLGAGNGTCVSMAGNAVNEVFRNFDIKVSGYRNSREIHQEFNGGSRIEGFIHQINSTYALQGGVATQGRNGIVFGEILNCGSAGVGGVNTGYPTIYGYVGSTGSDGVDVDLRVKSTNDDGFTLGTDGAISAGSAVFTSAAATFPANIVGKPITIEGANPSGAPLEAYVSSRDSATQLTLDINAQVTVSGATYGYGTGCRNPLIFNGTGSVNFNGSNVVGGVFSGLASEPTSAAVKFGTGSKSSQGQNMVIKAPSLIAGATAPVGLEIGASFGAEVMESGNLISGFTNNYKGFSTNSTATRCPINRKIVQEAFPSATIDTYGTDVEFSPRLQTFLFFYGMTIEFDSMGTETATGQLEAVFVDGGSTTVSVTTTVNASLQLTLAQLATLHSDNQKITKLQFRVKSSIGSSTARGRLSFLGVEG